MTSDTNSPIIFFQHAAANTTASAEITTTTTTAATAPPSTADDARPATSVPTPTRNARSALLRGGHDGRPCPAADGRGWRRRPDVHGPHEPGRRRRLQPVP